MRNFVGFKLSEIVKQLPNAELIHQKTRLIDGDGDEEDEYCWYLTLIPQTYIVAVKTYRSIGTLTKIKTTGEDIIIRYNEISKNHILSPSVKVTQNPDGEMLIGVRGNIECWLQFNGVDTDNLTHVEYAIKEQYELKNVDTPILVNGKWEMTSNQNLYMTDIEFETVLNSIADYELRCKMTCVFKHLKDNCVFRTPTEYEAGTKESHV